MNANGQVRTADDEVAVLLGRCAGGDQAAFRLLYERQSPRLYGLALRLLRQPTLAADAVHDAFLQVWQRSDRFDPQRGPAEAWLAALLRYRAIDILRRHGREIIDEEAVRNAVVDVPEGVEALSGDADGRALHRCLQDLDETGRRAVQLAFLDGLTHSELSVRLQAPLGTVKSRVRRALLVLKRCLEA